MNDRLLLFVLPATTNQLEAGQSNLRVVYMTNGILIRMLVIHSKENWRSESACPGWRERARRGGDDRGMVHFAIITSILIADCKLVFKVCGEKKTSHPISACLTCLNNDDIFVCL